MDSSGAYTTNVQIIRGYPLASSYQSMQYIEFFLSYSTKFYFVVDYLYYLSTISRQL